MFGLHTIKFRLMVRFWFIVRFKTGLLLRMKFRMRVNVKFYLMVMLLQGNCTLRLLDLIRILFYLGLWSGL